MIHSRFYKVVTVANVYEIIVDFCHDIDDLIDKDIFTLSRKS